MDDEYQARLEVLIDGTIDLLEEAHAAGVELDPLSTIIGRMQARGTEMDLSEAPPMLRMLLAGMDT